MGIETLQRHFDDCRLPVKFLPVHPRRVSDTHFIRATPASADTFCFVGVAKRQRVEHFRVYVHPDADMYLRDKRPATQHILLQMRCFPQNEHQAEVRNFLLGHDERQLFVISPQAADTVANALAALKPRPVMQAEQQGRKVIRQGDWFFIPMRDSFAPPPNEFLLTNQTIGGMYAWQMGIVVGNPHVVEEQVIVRPPQRETGQNTGRIMRAAFIVVRGKIRHSEHSTVELRGWHRAVQNTAALTFTPSIGYYD